MVLSEIVSSQDAVVVGMTGTLPKQETLRQIVSPQGVFVSGVIGLIQFEDAGKAPEPVTSRCLDLIVGKARGQNVLLERRINEDSKFLGQMKSNILLLARNDVNHTIAEIPITKSPLQKEISFIDEYRNLITASLKFLAMKHVGKVPQGLKWDSMQRDWKLIKRCLDFPFNERVYLPIDYQVVDAYEKRRIVDHHKNVKRYSIEPISPMISVERRAYAALELDFRQGDGLVASIIQDYLSKYWNEKDFNPARYQLGIQHMRMLGVFLEHGQNVLFDDHATPGVQYLKKTGAKERQLVLNRIEVMLNGFNKGAFDVASHALESPYAKAQRNRIIHAQIKPSGVIYQSRKLATTFS